MYGGTFLKEMSLEQTAFYRFWAADVTLAATAVAGIAVKFSGRLHLGMHRFVRIGPYVDHFLVWAQSHVKAGFKGLCNLVVALAAGL
jgi:hypothetical protein